MRSTVSFLMAALLLTSCSLSKIPAVGPGDSTTMSTAAVAPNACSWTVGSAQTVSGAQTILHSVAPISSTDAWAVGFATTGTTPRAIIEHFNGTSWSLATSPALNNSELLSVRAISANDLWAVGVYNDQPLAEHWNGATWQTVAVPAITGATETELFSASAVATNDVWAAGYAVKAGKTLAVVEHWNGTHWTLDTTPQPNPVENTIYAIVANSANNAWAIGNQGEYRSSTNPRRNLALHWNGSTWSVVPSPNAGASSTINYFYAASFVPGTDHIWAVGQYQTPQAFYETTLFWNGTKWTLVPSPTPGVKGDFLLGVVARSASDVWTVGTYYDASLTRHNFALQWNGSAWSNVAIPDVTSSNNDELFDIQLVPGTSGALAVGDFFTSTKAREPQGASNCGV